MRLLAITITITGAAFAASVLLAGCAVQPAGQRVADRLEGLEGLNIHYAVNILGYPASERTVLGDTVYTWYTSSTEAIPVPDSDTAYGQVSGEPFSATITTTGYVPVQFQCKIELATGSDHLIKHVAVEGNEGGCARYERLLR